MITSRVLVGLAKLLLGVSGRWIDPKITFKQRIYFANHTSHADTIAILAALPPEMRKNTRPVAALDYWGKNKFLSFFCRNGLNAILINRKASGHLDVLQPLHDALNLGESLIIFPEGTRSNQALPSEFKSGIYHLAQKHKNVELVPVYLENIYRCMPKGTKFPLPLICTVRFGEALPKVETETKEEFLKRAHSAVIGLSK